MGRVASDRRRRGTLVGPLALFVVEQFEDEDIEFAYPTQTLSVRHETQLDVERVGNGTERHAPSAPMA